MPLNTSGGNASVGRDYIDAGRDAHIKNVTTRDSNNINGSNIDGSFNHTSPNSTAQTPRHQVAPPRIPPRLQSSGRANVDFSDGESDSEMSDDNSARRDHAYSRQSEMYEDAILANARRIQEKRAAKAQRQQNPYSQPAQPTTSTFFEGNANPIRHPNPYSQPAYPPSPEHADAIRYPNPYSQFPQPTFSEENHINPIRRPNPYNQPAYSPFSPGNSDPIRTSYSQPTLPPFSQGHAEPYNSTAQPPFPQGHLDPYRPPNPYGQPTQPPYYQGNADPFQPPNSSNSRPTMIKSRNPFVSQVTPLNDRPQLPLWGRPLN